MKATAIILAGGKSSRMGTNKALLPLEGKANIAIIKEQLAPFFSKLMLVANDPQVYEFLQLAIETDEFKEKGPLAGIHAGLKKSETEVNFFVACDMPFVSGELARYLVSLSAHYDAVVPCINGRIQPLFSVFKKASIPKIELRLQKEQLRMKDLLDELNVLFVSKDDLQSVMVGNLDKIFYNMNNQDDYQKAKNML